MDDEITRTARQVRRFGRHTIHTVDTTSVSLGTGDDSYVTICGRTMTDSVVVFTTKPVTCRTCLQLSHDFA